MNKPTVLLDVDNTIFDTEKQRPLVYASIDANYGVGAGEKFEKINDQVRGELGWGNLQEAAMRFAKEQRSSDYASVMAAFLEFPFTKFWRPHAQELVNYLAANFNLVIFSDGDDIFQKTKIEKLGLFKKAKEVIIARSKVDLLGDIARKYPGKVIAIDDKPANLAAVKKVIPKAITIWVNYGSHAAKAKTIGADLETNDLAEVEKYLKSLAERSASQPQ